MTTSSRLGTYLVPLIFLLAWATFANEVDSNRAPKADAGLSRTVVVGEVVTLDASRSTDQEGDRLNFYWTLHVPPGSGATLSDANALRPQFTVDLLGEYTAELTVTDGKLDSVADSVKIRTGNVAPVAIIDMNSKIDVGLAIVLDGSASWDFNNDYLDYDWSLIEAPAGSRIALQSERSRQPTFAADVPGDYLVELTVSDGQYRSKAEQIWFSTVDARPTADAGSDRRTYTGTQIQFNGHASSDAENKPLAYQWSLLHTPIASRADLHAADSATPLLKIDEPGLYLIQLITHDGVHASTPDTIVISASMPSLSTGTPALSGAQDADGDGIPDDSDNCAEHANPTQLDSNGDGFGNRCDADLDNDGFITNFGDLVIWVAAFNSTPALPHWNPDADFNGDNVVNFGDLFIFTTFFQNPPGPIVNRFTNPAGGSWHDPANWSRGVVPNATHTVRIDIGAGVFVEYSTGASTIWGLRSTTEFMQTGGDLWVNGDMEVNASVTLTGSGSLTDANILAPTTSDVIVIPSSMTFTLDNVTLGADIMVEAGGQLFVDNDLTLSGATITLASDNTTTYLRFRGVSGASSTLGGTGEVVFGGTATLDNRNVIDVYNSLDGLVIGSGVTVRSATSGGQIFHRFNNGAVTMQGTLISNLAGRTVTMSGVPLSIEGTVQVSNSAVLDANFVGIGIGGAITSSAMLSATTNGELQLRGEWVNAGSITVTDAVLDLGNLLTEEWDNNGTITLSNATLELGGSFTVADVGTVNGTGTVIIDGRLDNTGETLDVGVDLPGTTVLLGQGGEIISGSVVNTALVLPASTSFTLDNVTLGADITVEAGGQLFVDDDLTLSGATITLASNNTTTYLRFRGVSGASSTLGGTGEVVFGGTATLDNRNVIDVYNSLDGLVIGSGVTVRSATSGGQIFHRFNNGAVTMQGTLISNVAGRTVTMSGVPLSIEGTVQVSNSAILDANFVGTGGMITASAMLSATTNGELRLRGEWVNAGSITVTDAVLDLGNLLTEEWDNNGTITLSNATLELGGSFTVADVGTVNGTGTVIIDGRLDNTGETLDVGVDLPGTTVVLGQGGEIIGGSVVNTALVLPASTSFTLDNVTLGADITVEAGGQLFVDDDLTLSGATITLASNNTTTYLRFRGVSGASSTLGGTGEVVFGGTATLDNRNVIDVYNSLDGLVIGSGVTVRSATSGGQIFHRFNNGAVTMQGTLISNLAGRTVTMSGVPLSIEGTVQVSNSAVLDANFVGIGIGGAITSSAMLSATTNGELQLRGEWVNAGSITVTDAVLDLGNLLTEEWDNNGTITLSNATLELGGSFTVADVGTVNGTGTVIIDGRLDNTGETLDVGVDLPGTTVVLGQGGEIIGGSVVNTALVLPASTSFTLDNVTLGADITVEAGGQLFVDDDLTLSGATITLASNNTTTYLRFRGVSGASSTLGGTGEVVFGGTATLDNRNVIDVYNSLDGLVIGSGVTVRSATSGGQIFHRFNNGAVTMQGTLISNVAGRTVTMSGVPLSIEGTVQVSNSAILDANFVGTGGMITASAMLSATTNGELRLRGEWVNAGSITVTDAVLDLGNLLTEEWDNNGTITLSNATLELGGSFTVADVGTVNGTGTVIIDGRLDNTGETLDVGVDLPGTTVVLGQGGEIIGGSVVNTALVLPASTSFTLDNVTLGADITVEAGGQLFVDDDLTLSGATITLASNNTTTYLRFRGVSGASSTLGGTGEVVFGGTATLDNRNVIDVYNSLDGLVIGSGVTVRSATSGGQIFHRFNNGAVTMQGTLISNVAGRTVTMSGVPLSIEGTVQAGAGSVINFTSDYSLTASAAFDVDVGGTATTDFGRFTAAGRTATLNGTLNISLVNAFAPALSDTFEIMTCGSCNNSFTTENGTGIGGGLNFQVNYNATNVTLEVVN